MLKRIFEKRIFVQACAVLVAALALAGNRANAESALKSAASLDELLATIDVELSTSNVAQDKLQPENIELPELQPSVVSFIKECADLDAIPLVELSKRKDRRVFIGISFDGLIGIHARL